MRSFVSDEGVSGFPQLGDEDADTWTTFNIRYQPSWAWVKPNGSIESGFGSIPQRAINAATR